MDPGGPKLVLWALTPPCDLVTLRTQILLRLKMICSWRQQLLVDAARGPSETWGLYPSAASC